MKTPIEAATDAIKNIQAFTVPVAPEAYARAAVTAWLEAYQARLPMYFSSRHAAIRAMLEEARGDE